MLLKHSFYFEFQTPYCSFFAFDLSTLLNELPTTYRNVCLTQLN